VGLAAFLTGQDQQSDSARERAHFPGKDIDLDARIPSVLVCECSQVEPSIMAAAGPYLGMLALPTIMESVQDKARAVLATGGASGRRRRPDARRARRTDPRVGGLAADDLLVDVSSLA
jgi:hypothetical protein